MIDSDTKKPLSVLTMKHNSPVKHASEVYNGSHSRVINANVINLDKVCTYILCIVSTYVNSCVCTDVWAVYVQMCGLCMYRCVGCVCTDVWAVYCYTYVHTYVGR